MAPRLLTCLALTLALLGWGLPTGRAATNNGTYQTTAPTAAGIANWDTGWGATGISGWDFVGSVNGASGVYLRNGWVITAGHVGAGGFTVMGVGYSFHPNSVTTISNGNGTNADLTLFQLTSLPPLPTLNLRATAPAPATYFANGSVAAMIGYGGGVKAWSANQVTFRDISVTVTAGNRTYTSTSFRTDFGTVTLTGPGNLSRTISNPGQLVGGDSGGGAFIYNGALNRWELAGINDAVDNQGNSYFVQLSTYASEINAITTVAPVPEPEWIGASVAALLLMAIVRRRRAFSS